MTWTNRPNWLSGVSLHGAGREAILDQISYLTSQTELLTPLAAYKSSDQTVNNTTTLVNVTSMSVAVATNTRYDIAGYGLLDSGTVPDFKIGWTFPSGLTMVYSVLAFNAGTFRTDRYDQTSTPAIDGAGAGSIDEYLWWGSVSTGSTGGTLQMQFAQNTANASNTIFKAGSKFQLIKTADI